MVVFSKLNACQFHTAIVSQSVTENCALCRVEHPQIFCILLAHGLTAVFVVGGLGSEDQQSGL